MKTINKNIKNLIQEENITPKLIEKGSMKGFIKLTNKKESYTDTLNAKLINLGFSDIIGNKEEGGFCLFARNNSITDKLTFTASGAF